MSTLITSRRALAVLGLVAIAVGASSSSAFAFGRTFGSAAHFGKSVHLGGGARLNAGPRIGRAPLNALNAIRFAGGKSFPRGVGQVVGIRPLRFSPQLAAAALVGAKHGCHIDNPCKGGLITPPKHNVCLPNAGKLMCTTTVHPKHCTAFFGCGQPKDRFCSPRFSFCRDKVQPVKIPCSFLRGPTPNFCRDVVPPVIIRPVVYPVYQPYPVYRPAYQPVAYRPAYQAPAYAPPAPAAIQQPTSVSVVFQPTATSADITNFIKSYNITVSNGPDANGIYRLQISTGPVAADQLSQIVQSMRSQTNIVAQVGA